MKRRRSFFFFFSNFPEGKRNTGVYRWTWTAASSCFRKLTLGGKGRPLSIRVQSWFDTVGGGGCRLLKFMPSPDFPWGASSWSMMVTAQPRSHWTCFFAASKRPQLKNVQEWGWHLHLTEQKIDWNQVMTFQLNLGETHWKGSFDNATNWGKTWE